MKYVVVKDFSDLQDNGHVYRTGDEFPRSGAEASEDRLAELASKNNKRGEALIEKAAKPAKKVEEVIEVKETEEVTEEKEPEVKKSTRSIKKKEK